jgi:hypothetical protein
MADASISMSRSKTPRLGAWFAVVASSTLWQETVFASHRERHESSATKL